MVMGGRRSGKSFALADRTTVLSIVFARNKGAVLSPTYAQGRNVFDHIRRCIPRSWLKPGRYGINWNQKRLTFVNGCTIVFITADNHTSSRSYGVAFWSRDEMQDISEEAAGSSQLSTSEGGENYYVSDTATIKAKLRPHYDRLVASSSARVYFMDGLKNPFINKKFLEDARELMDQDLYDMEVRGKWPELRGRVYYNFDEGLHVKRWPIVTRPDVTKEFLHEKFDTPYAGERAPLYIIGLDPPHHAVVATIHRGGLIHICDEVVIEEKGDIRDLVRVLKKRYFPGFVVTDPHETHWDVDVRKWFKQAGYRMGSLRRIEIEYRVTAVRALLERDKINIDPRCIKLIESLNKQTYIDDKPDKKTGLDHILDALGYLCYKIAPTKIDYEKEERLAA